MPLAQSIVSKRADPFGTLSDLSKDHQAPIVETEQSTERTSRPFQKLTSDNITRDSGSYVTLLREVRERKESERDQMCFYDQGLARGFARHDR